MGGYVSPGMGPRRARTITDLILRRGDTAANRAMGSGHIWANALGNLGNVIGGAIQQHQEKKQRDEQTAHLGQMLQDPEMVANPQKLYMGLAATYGPESAGRIFEGLTAVEKYQKAQKGEQIKPKDAMTLLEKTVPGWLDMNQADRAMAYPLLRGAVSVLNPEAQLPEEYDPEIIDPLAQTFMEQKEPATPGSDEWLMTADEGDIGALRERRGLLNPEEDKPDNRSLETRLAEAAAGGDSEAYERLLKAKADLAAAAREPKSAKGAKTPWSKPYKGDNGRWYQYNEETGDTRLAGGMGQEQAAAAKASSRGDAQQKVAKLLGSKDMVGKSLEDGGDPDSLYDLVMSHTLPGGELVAAAVGTGAKIADWMRMPGRAGLEMYTSQKEGFIPLLARAVGHTGVLTEPDVKRTERLLPVLTGPYADSREVAIRKLDRLQRIMMGDEEMPPGIWRDAEQGIYRDGTDTASNLDPEIQAELDSMNFPG